MNQDKPDQVLVKTGTTGHTATGAMVPDDNSASEMPNLDDPQKTPPAVHDQQSFSGTNPALTSDDDIDEIGKEYGVTYDDQEELNITNKVNITTKVTSK